MSNQNEIELSSDVVDESSASEALGKVVSGAEPLWRPSTMAKY